MSNEAGNEGAGAFSGAAAAGAPTEGNAGSGVPAGAGAQEGGAPTGAAGGEGGAGAGGEPSAPTIPETYELKTPDGVEVPENITKAFAEFAKGSKLTAEQAQAAFDHHLQTLQSGYEQAKAAYDTQVAGWKASLNADKELGGEKLAENLRVADRGLDAIGSPELKQALKDFGLLHHPEFVRAFFRAGQRISDDSMEKGKGRAGNAGASLSQRLYGTKG